MICAEQFLQLRLDGGGPDSVAGVAGMQIVVHHGFGNGAVVFNQLRTEINVENVFAIIEPGQRLVDLENLSTLRAERLAARENAEQDDFRVRLARADLLHDGLTPSRMSAVELSSTGSVVV